MVKSLSSLSVLSRRYSQPDGEPGVAIAVHARLCTEDAVLGGFLGSDSCSDTLSHHTCGSFSRSLEEELQDQAAAGSSELLRNSGTPTINCPLLQRRAHHGPKTSASCWAPAQGC